MTSDSARLRQGGVATLNTMAPGAGISGATGEVVKWAVSKDPVSGLIHTVGLIDLTGLASVATENDIIAVGTSDVAYLGRITAAVNGTIIAGKMTLLETPATGEVDIDVWASPDGTGVGSGLITDMTGEDATFTAAGDWGTVREVNMTNPPTANDYLYLTVGTGSTPTAATYTAGIFLLEFWGV